MVRRARAIEHTLWVTPYSEDERWPCGEFPNLSAEDSGLPVWTARDRSIEDADVVLWYVFGINHVTRPEDWPVMPVDTVSFWLKPVGFFDRNPALDVPAPTPDTMFDHVTIRVTDRDASERFYNTVLRTLGDRPELPDQFVLGVAGVLGDRGRPGATRRRGASTSGSRRRRRDHVDEFWRVGTEAGYADDGPPGPRPEYGEDYYGAFLLDPDGNSAEAVHDSRHDPGGASSTTCGSASPTSRRPRRSTRRSRRTPGSGSATDTPDRVQFVGAGGSFSLVRRGHRPSTSTWRSEPTTTRTSSGSTQVATAAGYSSNGAPGERPRYHPGYYAAYVFDPDGNNIEVVNHNRG